jgi:hypothetical protein
MRKASRNDLAQEAACATVFLSIRGAVMSDNSSFAKMVPGFDFLQNLATNPLTSPLSGTLKSAAASIPQLPNPANWIAPTLSTEELDKRLEELKAVQFWLDQNAKALQATITALEVQKMTLNTLKGMNFNMGDVANAFKLKAADTVASTVISAKERVTSTFTGSKPKAKKTSAKSAAPNLIDPMQWWGSLTQQFGEIAQNAMKDAARQTSLDATKHMAKAVGKTMGDVAKQSMRGAVSQTAKAMQAASSRAARPSPSTAKPARKASTKSAAKKRTR